MRRIMKVSKRSLVAILAVLVAFSASACTSDGGSRGSPSGMKSYEGNGFGILYPGGWKELGGRNKLIPDSKFEVVDMAKGSQVPNASLDVLVSPAVSSLRRASEDLVVLSRSSKNFKLIENKETSVSGGAVAYRVVQSYAGRAPGGPVLLRQTDLLTATRNDEQVDIRIACQVKVCQTRKDVIDRMLASVKLT